MIKKITLSFTLSFIAICNMLNAQGDGPRAWYPSAVNVNMVSPFYININNANQIISNNLFFKNGELSTNVYGVLASRSFAVGKYTGGLALALSGGNVDGGIEGTSFQSKGSGFADPQVIGVLNLYGAHAVDKETYLKTKYDLIVTSLVGVKIPIGSYDSNEIFNLGANRWEFRFGVPIIKFWNWGSPTYTSIEFTPNVYFFTPNNNPFGDANKLEQKALFIFESHIVQHLNKMLWVSADGVYKTGGETVSDGIDSDNAMNGLTLGGTLGAELSRSMNIKFTYGGVVAAKQDNIKGSMFRVVLVALF